MEPVVGSWTLVDLAVVAGLALVLPVGLGHRSWWWAVAAAAAGATIAEPGSVEAVVLALVWPAVTVGVVLGDAVQAGPLLFWMRADLVRAVAGLYTLVAATWFVLSCAGATPLGIDEPIVELTAVHFTFVGVGALTLAAAALGAARSPAGHRVGWVGTGLTASAPVVVASGFATGVAVLQIGGAVMMSVGVFATAGLQLAEATRRGPLLPRLALGASGLAVWSPMVLAVAWATAQHLSTPALSTADMVPAHGAVNAVAFIGAGLVGRWLQERHRPVTTREEGTDAPGRTATGPALPV